MKFSSMRPMSYGRPLIPMVRPSIRRSIASTLLILAVAPLSVLGISLTWYSYEVQKQQAIDLQEEVSRRAADEIYRPIEEIQYDLNSAADVFDVMKLSSHERNNILKRLQFHADRGHQNILYSLTIVDSNGMELNKVSIREIYTAEDFRDISANPEFIIPTTKGDVYFSPVWFDDETGDPRLTLSMPWHNSRTMKIDAVLVSELRLKELWASVMDIRAGPNGNTFVTDGQGRVVAHRNPSIVLRGTTFMLPEKAGFHTGLDGESVSLAFADIQLGQQGLYIVTEQPIQDALDLTITTLITLVSAFVVALLLSIGVGYMFVHRMIMPIESLAETAKAISKGDLSRKAKANRDDETGILADAFNNMTTRLINTISRLEDNMSHIDHMAHYDRLTDLPNRRSLEINLNKCLSEAKRHRKYGALIFLDLDHFKTINDSLGHPVGDSLLVQVAKRLKQEIRVEDMVSRLGGDEFVVVLANISENLMSASHKAQRVAEKLRLALSEPYELEGIEYRTTASIGMTMFPYGDDTTNELIKHADTAMYSSKESGRNSVHFYHPDMQRAVTERLTLERELHLAINNEEFILYFQPIVSLEEGVVGVESLIRWRKPNGDYVSTDHFIPLAEDTGLIIPIGDWVLRGAFTKFVEWMSMGDAIKCISVNISYRQFHEDDFVKNIMAMIGETGMPPKCLKIEITESIMMSDIEATIEKMTQLKSMGIRFSIDDFGTGYSSLSYLSRLPIDILKIDRSFVRNVPYHIDGAAIVETIMAMAENLKLHVIAEGVETEAQLKFLRSKGDICYQGYFFSKPLPESELLDFVAEYNKNPFLTKATL
ncbi:EAL domain-containing protein [Pseudomonadota bacterium]